MTTTLHRLSQANTIDEVISATSDFLSSWAPGEFERLGPGYGGMDVRTAADIELWADRLQHGPLPLLDEDDARLERLLSHFLIASVKLRQVDSSLRAC